MLFARFQPIAWGLVLLLTMTAMARAQAPSVSPITERVIVALVVNDQRTDESALVLKGPAGTYVARAALIDARLIIGPGANTISEAGAAYVLLSTLPGVTFHLDNATQELRIAAAPQAITRQIVDLSPEAVQPVHSTTSGGFINYDTLGQRGTTNYLAGTIDGGASIGSGMLLFSALGRQASTDAGVTRLETAWVRDVPASMLRVKLGDSISRGGDWGQPNRFGGIQIASNFAVQPGFIPYPLPSFSGQAGLPSTVDVFVNNMLTSHTAIDQGPFSLNQIPMVTGGGDANIVVTDLLGRQQVVTAPFYIAPTMLRKGLSDFSYEFGSLRTDLGVESNRYRDIAASATHRYGVTDDVTVEGHAEIVGSHRAAGSSVTTDVFNLGILQGEGAVGGNDQHHGVLAGIAFSRVMRGWSFGITQRWLSPSFASSQTNVTGTSGSQSTQTVVSLGVSFRDYGAFSASAARQTFVNATSAAVASLNWTKSITQRAFVSAYVSMARQATNNTTFGLTFSIQFGSGNSVTSDFSLVNRRPQGTIAARHDEGPSEGLSYGVLTNEGDVNRVYGDAVYRAPHGDIGGAIDQFNGQTNGRLTASGGIAIADGTVFATRRLDDAFAVVSVPGFPGVTIMQENRPIGKTDSDGRLLVPSLVSYYPTKIGLNSDELPITADVDQLDQTVTTGFRTPTVVTFDVRATGPQLVSIHRPDGAPVASGIRITRLSDGKIYHSGFAGEAYIDPDTDGSRFTAADSIGNCHFSLPASDNARAQTDVTCGPAS